MRLALPRKGFTLLELMLVMAIIVIIIAVAYPSMEAMWGDSRVRGAADDVVGAWAEARVRAIDSGVPHRFSVMEGKETFRIAPDSEEYWDGSQADNEDERSGRGKSRTGSLPKGIVFRMNNANNAMGMMGSSGPWKTVAVFLPDGTCKNDASITVEAESGQPLVIRVRALTGITTVRTRRQLEDNP